MDAEMTEEGVEDVEKCVLLHQNTITHYIVTHQILGICLVVQHRLGAQVSQRWWEQNGIYLSLGERKTADWSMEAGI